MGKRTDLEQLTELESIFFMNGFGENVLVNTKKVEWLLYMAGRWLRKEDDERLTRNLNGTSKEG